ncbi:MAG: hypothetical protein KatS3mg014_0492 [Actinomycetota bacterium]|nr:MAG: hypothetical protein KatS3mg014_0492 [Actinomycetota bacterium]
MARGGSAELRRILTALGLGAVLGLAMGALARRR